MDVRISRWILEFLLRQPLEDCKVDFLLDIFPFSNCLLKTLLLRKISSEISLGSISEKILESLERIEQYDYENGIPVLDSMREAYCDVAVHCTVMCLNENLGDCRSYYDSVIRIWKGRVEDMERWERVGLVSDRLKGYRVEIEETLWSLSALSNVVMRDTLSDALKSVGVFLAEADVEMGPSFLEIIAKTLDEKGNKVVQVSPKIEGEAKNEGEVKNDTLENQNLVDMNVCVPPCVETFHAKEAISRNYNATSRPSLMEKNNTACFFEWGEDSLESSTREGSPIRCHLSTPKKRVVSPSEDQEIKKKSRKKPNKWSSLEEQTLLDAVNEYGKGKWKVILDKYHEIFEERTWVSLRKKWISLTKANS